MKPVVQNFLIVVAMLLVAGVLAAAGAAVFFWSSASSSTTAPGAYASRYKQWKPSGLVDHFPDPQSPLQILQFSARDRELQGGAHIQLRVRLSEKAIADLNSTTSSSAIIVANQSSTASASTACPPPSFFTEAVPSQDRRFPPNFTVYYLFAQDLGQNWNHGNTAGIAISLSTNEAVYWAESW